MKAKKIFSMNSGRFVWTIARNVDLRYWQRRREAAEAKLRSELDKKLHRYEGYIDRLQRRAGAQFQPGEDGWWIILSLAQN
jgi:hypothetical protein